MLPTAVSWIAAPQSVGRKSYRTVLHETAVLEPVLDFTTSSSFEKIDRLDDAIMGGISTSSVQPADGFARWVGVCRTDGGGFCGFRTNPFETPLKVGNADGFYITCRLTSDDEPERRVWKLSTRLKPGRSERLFLAPVQFQNKTTSDKNEYQTIQIPFESFRYVRGARMISDGPKFNVSSGFYQLGMTMSKFVFGENMTGLENFRDGFFELQIKSVGVYKNEGELTGLVQPTVLNKTETKEKRPVAVKVLSPVAKLFFSEQSQRRKSAMRILREKRGYTRLQAIYWGWKIRKNKFRSSLKTLSILGIDTFRTVASTVLRLTVFFPILLISKFINLISPKKQTTQSS